MRYNKVLKKTKKNILTFIFRGQLYMRIELNKLAITTACEKLSQCCFILLIAHNHCCFVSRECIRCLQYVIIDLDSMEVCFALLPFFVVACSSSTVCWLNTESRNSITIKVLLLHT